MVGCDSGASTKEWWLETGRCWAAAPTAPYCWRRPIGIVVWQCPKGHQLTTRSLKASVIPLLLAKLHSGSRRDVSHTPCWLSLCPDLSRGQRALGKSKEEYNISGLLSFLHMLCLCSYVLKMLFPPYGRNCEHVPCSTSVSDSSGEFGRAAWVYGVPDLFTSWSWSRDLDRNLSCEI